MQRGGPLDRQRQAADLHRRQHRPEAGTITAPNARASRCRALVQYICESSSPVLLEINREQGEDHTGCILTGGASMGAARVSFCLRRPDIFNSTIALSGLYSSGMFFGSYMDDLVYRNSPAITCATSRRLTPT